MPVMNSEANTSVARNSSSDNKGFTEAMYFVTVDCRLGTGNEGSAPW